MLVSIFAITLGAAVQRPPKNFKLPPGRPPAACKGKCAARYRLPLASDTGPDIKRQALAQDGKKCDVVGAQRCLSKTRVLLRSDQDPADTLSATLTPQ